MNKKLVFSLMLLLSAGVNANKLEKAQQNNSGLSFDQAQPSSQIEANELPKHSMAERHTHGPAVLISEARRANKNILQVSDNVNQAMQTLRSAMQSNVQNHMEGIQATVKNIIIPEIEMSHTIIKALDIIAQNTALSLEDRTFLSQVAHHIQATPAKMNTLIHTIEGIIFSVANSVTQQTLANMDAIGQGTAMNLQNGSNQLAQHSKEVMNKSEQNALENSAETVLRQSHPAYINHQSHPSATPSTNTAKQTIITKELMNTIGRK